MKLTVRRAPENGWLEDDDLFPFWGPASFQGLWLLVSGRVYITYGEAFF